MSETETTGQTQARKGVHFVHQVRVQAGYPVLVATGPHANRTGKARHRDALTGTWNLETWRHDSINVHRRDMVVPGDMVCLPDGTTHEVTMSDVQPPPPRTTNWLVEELATRR